MWRGSYLKFCVYFLAATTLAICKEQESYAVFVETVNSCPGQNVIDVSRMRITRVDRKDGNIFGVKGNATILADLPEDATITSSFHFLYNTRKTWSKAVYVSQSTNVCEWVETDKKFFPVIQNGTTIPKKCPILKATHQIIDAVWKFRDLPPVVANGCWKAEFVLKVGKKVIGCFYGTAKVANVNEEARPRCTP